MIFSRLIMSSNPLTVLSRFAKPTAAVSLIPIVVLAGLSPQASARELHVYQGDSFKEVVENLEPGDVVTVHDGTYTDTGRISIAVKGTRASPVVITAAPDEARPLITRSPGTRKQNTINIEGAEYLTIRGLEISSNGSDGITMKLEPSFVTLEDLVIHDVGVGVNFRSDMHHITVRRTEIYNTNATGEGMYVGCNNAKCSVSQSIIESNWIHDTLAAKQGDGIEIKNGSHSNLIRNNVIHDTNFPCILLYGSNGHPRNVVEGNVMWNCGNSGIQAAADAIIRNNIILDSPYNGFNSRRHQGVSPANLEFVHNTVIGGENCVSLDGWDNARGMVFANNAVYCPDGTLKVDGFSGVALSGNVLVPNVARFRSRTNTAGRSLVTDFIGVSGQNFYPSGDSALLDAGDPAYAALLDFNGTQRQVRVDAGAYARTDRQNPGWEIGAGFKAVSPEAEIYFRAVPETVNAGDSTVLSWHASNVDSCESGGDWTGTRMLAGSETVGPINAHSIFELVCEGASGFDVRILTVMVRDVPAAAPAPVRGVSGAPDPLFFLSLLLATGFSRLRHRRQRQNYSPDSVYGR